MGQPVVHFEIGCKDKPATQAFYSKLFGWKMNDAGPAAMIDTGANMGIDGHITALGHEPYHYTIFYVQVDDVQACIDQATALGGKMLVPPVNIPGGTFAWIADPEHNTVGLWKPA
jgi:predicted enzyme related to lactoylglutathione lyase